MTIIDAHAHVYPDAIAQKAANSIGSFYDITICCDGSLSTLLERGDRAGISRFLVQSVATSWERVQSINNYLMRTVAEHSDRLLGFGAMHPSHPDPRTELLRIQAGGLRGIKLHPDIQQFPLDSPKTIALYHILAELKMPVLVHLGDPRYAFSHPVQMARAMDAVPGLKVIGAHLGGRSLWDEGCAALAGRPGLWVDCSDCMFAMPPEQAASLIHRYGTDRVFFGSDYPVWDPAREVERFMAIPLRPAEQEQILHQNFESFWETLA